MKKLGKKQLTLHLQEPLQRIPAELAPWGLELKADGHDLVYTVDGANSIDISALLEADQRVVDRGRRICRLIRARSRTSSSIS